MFWGRRSGRPGQRFGKSIEELARGTLQGYATLAKTKKKNPAVGRIELEKVRAAQQIRAFRMFFLEHFGILAEETRGALFAGEMQPCEENQLFSILLFVDH